MVKAKNEIKFRNMASASVKYSTVAARESLDILNSVEESSFNPKHALAWLEQQPEDDQTL